MCSLRKIDDSWKTVLTLLDAITASRQAQYAARKSLGEDEIDDLFTKLVSSTDGAAKYALEPPDVVSPVSVPQDNDKGRIRPRI